VIRTCPFSLPHLALPSLPFRALPGTQGPPFPPPPCCRSLVLPPSQTTTIDQARTHARTYVSKQQHSAHASCHPSFPRVDKRAGSHHIARDQPRRPPPHVFYTSSCNCPANFSWRNNARVPALEELFSCSRAHQHAITRSGGGYGHYEHVE
jgi:hypothetical protein